MAPAARTPCRAPSAAVQQAAASNICFQSLPHLTRVGKSRGFAAVRGLKSTVCGQNPLPLACSGATQIKKNKTPAVFFPFFNSKARSFLFQVSKTDLRLSKKFSFSPGVHQHTSRVLVLGLCGGWVRHVPMQDLCLCNSLGMVSH